MADSARERIAANVRAELARAGRTQRDAARALEMDQSPVWQRMTGQRAFKAEEIEALAAWLRIPVGTLLDGAEQSAGRAA